MRLKKKKMIQSILNTIAFIKKIFTNPLGAVKDIWQKLIDLKNTILNAGVLGVLIFIASYFVAWWAGAIVAFFYVAFKKEIAPKEAFGIGMTAGLVVWTAYAGYLDVMNDGLIAKRIGGLVSVGSIKLSSSNILQITSLIGGLLCAMGGLTGAYAREFLYDTRIKFGLKW
jgi:hypothetical protein